MRPTLTYLTAIGPWVIACPVGGGELIALSAEAAARGHEEGWLEGYGEAKSEREKLTALVAEHEGLMQARQTQPEGG